MMQERKFEEESDTGGDSNLNCENRSGLQSRPKRMGADTPNEFFSTRFKIPPPSEGSEETGSSSGSSSESEDSATSLAILDPRKRGGGVIESLINHTERSKRPRYPDMDESLYPPPSKKPKQTHLETDDSGSEIQSDDDSGESYGNFDSPVEPPRKIHLAPDRYAEYISKVERKEGVRQYNEHAKRWKPWELRSQRERGPRAGRSDEFLTREEAQYAENIIREATRHRLETWHRERNEMWGVKAIQYPEKTYAEMKALEEHKEDEYSEVEDVQTEEKPDSRSRTPDSGIGTLPRAASIRQSDVDDGATIEEILQGIPDPLDPCFENPTDIIFLPSATKFTEVVFSLEYYLGYTRKQVLWLMGGIRAGRGSVPSANTISMRLKRYMRKNNLMNAVKASPATATTANRPRTSSAKGKSTVNSDCDEGEEEESHSGANQEPPLLPHGPRIPRPEFGVHGWVWDHPHEERERLGDYN